LFVGVLAPFWIEFTLGPVLALALVAGYGVAVATGTVASRDEARPRLFRALVVALHVLQPFARAWGRLTRPSEPPTPTRRRFSWNGDRDAWNEALIAELGAHRFRAHPAGPHDEWDISATRGAFVACRVTTAVVWQWTPVHRVRVRLRSAALAVAFAIGALAAAVTPTVLAVFAPLAAASLVALMRARAAAREAIEATVRDARSTERVPSDVDEIGPCRSSFASAAVVVDQAAPLGPAAAMATHLRARAAALTQKDASRGG
jgi:hypothetical protein